MCSKICSCIKGRLILEKNLELAELMFPNVSQTINDLEIRYPKRKIDGEVTRYAPSPTGFLHTGSLFTEI